MFIRTVFMMVVFALFGVLPNAVKVFANDTFSCAAKFVVSEYPNLMKDEIVRNGSGVRTTIECEATERAFKERLGDLNINYKYTVQGSPAADINFRLSYNQICRTLYSKGKNFSDEDWAKILILYTMDVEDRYANYTLTEWETLDPKNPVVFNYSLLPRENFNTSASMDQTIYLIGSHIKGGENRTSGFTFWYRAKIDMLKDLATGGDIRKYTRSALGYMAYEKMRPFSAQCQ